MKAVIIKYSEINPNLSLCPNDYLGLTPAVIRNRIARLKKSEKGIKTSLRNASGDLRKALARERELGSRLIK